MALSVEKVMVMSRHTRKPGPGLDRTLEKNRFFSGSRVRFFQRSSPVRVWFLQYAGIDIPLFLIFYVHLWHTHFSRDEKNILLRGGVTSNQTYWIILFFEQQNRVKRKNHENGNSKSTRGSLNLIKCNWNQIDLMKSHKWVGYSHAILSTIIDQK